MPFAKNVALRIVNIKTLAEYMHNVGDISSIFQEDLVQDFRHSKSALGSDAIYRVLDNRGIEQNLGNFATKNYGVWRSKYQDYHNQLCG